MPAPHGEGAQDGPGEAAEEYDGPAVLVVDGREVTAHARLSGRFEPISGRYQWAGRLRLGEENGDLLRPNAGTVELRTDGGHAAQGAVREQDPWGGFRVSGEGRPPFAVPSEAP
jgi:Domain of unknown function (DUF4873)